MFSPRSRVSSPHGPYKDFLLRVVGTRDLRKRPDELCGLPLVTTIHVHPRTTTILIDCRSLVVTPGPRHCSRSFCNREYSGCWWGLYPWNGRNYLLLFCVFSSSWTGPNVSVYPNFGPDGLRSYSLESYNGFLFLWVYGISNHQVVASQGRENVSWS